MISHIDFFQAIYSTQLCSSAIFTRTTFYSIYQIICGSSWQWGRLSTTQWVDNLTGKQTNDQWSIIERLFAWLENMKFYRCRAKIYISVFLLQSHGEQYITRILKSLLGGDEQLIEASILSFWLEFPTWKSITFVKWLIENEYICAL